MKAVVILEVMWDWRNVTGRAGYKETAPPWFSINPKNHSGRRLHGWLKEYEFVVTNACPQLVSSARDRGTFDRAFAHEARVIELPHPAARQWTRQGIDLVADVIQHQHGSCRIMVNNKQFSAEPFPVRL